ncbi:MAG TPA: carboxypeptidase regulatory-like domain-containing protein [Stellaceae bacterium]|jgi:streptogramin lyase|nr:carboxypeptidase regulatory-like domain-containing protein [Stellaceae bacterium]
MLRVLGLTFALLGITAMVDAAPVRAAANDVALTGRVTSPADGPMEGVIVSAKQPNGTVTVSVVTDHDGRYSFPAARLAPGHYFLAARADGYEIDGTGVTDIAAGKTTADDLTLHKAGNLAAQLNDAEWLMSIPGTDQQKKFLLNCDGCHTLQRIAQSTHTPEEWMPLFDRMAKYCPCSTPSRPQPMVRAPHGDLPQAAREAAAKYLASINLSTKPNWDYPLKTLPRATGRATRVIVTEYALSRPTIEPHDVVVDSDGIVWFSEFADNALGRLDPKTGKVAEFKLPQVKKDDPAGTLNLEMGPDGNLWLSLQFQAAFAKFDRKTNKFTVWQIPQDQQDEVSQVGFTSPASSSVDHKVWTRVDTPNSFYRLDLASMKLDRIGPVLDPQTHQPLNAYGIPVDRENNLYLLDFGSDKVSRIDAKTLQPSVYHTPTPGSRPRRGRFDAQDHLWFAEYGANRIAMFDPKTTQFHEYEIPTPWTNPYDVVADKNGDIWTASMFTDRVVRLNPETGTFTEYPLPEQATNIRRVFIDNSGSRPVFWAGSNHNAGILKVEPLD